MSAANVLNIAVGSTNPGKIEAVRSAFSAVFPGSELRIYAVSVESGVPSQPRGDVETKNGAECRARNADNAYTLEHGSTPDFAVGLEGGVCLEAVQCFAWMAIHSRSQMSCARTASFSLPKAISDLMITEGLELGDADDKFFGRSNSKQEDGSVGILTGGLITRSTYYHHSLVLALIPFIPANAKLYLNGN